MQSLETIGLAALSNAGDFRSSYELAARCIREGIPGDFVECGVFGGSQAAAMAAAIVGEEWSGVDRWHGPTAWNSRRVHLFDSFEGVPEPGPQDRDFVAGGNAKGTSACSLEAVQANMKQWGVPDELLVYHKGVFSMLSPLQPFFGRTDDGRASWPRQIALLRLDLDLYDGTLAALNMLYRELVPGGFCIIDDYALDGCRQAVLEYMGGGFPPIYWQKQP